VEERGVEVVAEAEREKGKRFQMISVIFA